MYTMCTMYTMCYVLWYVNVQVHTGVLVYTGMVYWYIINADIVYSLYVVYCVLWDCGPQFRIYRTRPRRLIYIIGYSTRRLCRLLVRTSTLALLVVRSL